MRGGPIKEEESVETPERNIKSLDLLEYFDFSGGTVVFGSGGSVQDFNTAFINLSADTNQSGLRIDRSANTNASQTTSVDSEFFWDETLVGSGNNNTSHRGWRVKGFTNASTPLANTSDVVTFYNAKDLISCKFC